MSYIDRRITQILVTAHSQLTEDALAILVYENIPTIDKEVLLDAIDAVIRNKPHGLGDEFSDRVHQALAYTREDGRAFYDSSYDAV